MGSMITEGRAMRKRGNLNFQAHGVDTTTPSQTQGWKRNQIGLRSSHRELNLVSKNTQLTNYDWKSRKGESGKQHKVIASNRDSPGVSYESDWRSSRDHAYYDVSSMNRRAKAKQE
tara:strand:+ start:403 stop:750 length:348 start_codon:yes stop_codon:yes gene_type:complete